MTHKLKRALMGAAALGFGLALGLAAPANASVFHFTFDYPDNTVAGTGTLSFDGNLADGSYTLDTLANLAMSYTIQFQNGPETFTLADNTAPLDQVDAILTTIAPGVQQLQFDSYNGDYGNGIVGGAIDFYNADQQILDFAPSIADSSLTEYAVGDIQLPYYFGTYFASTAVPEPGMLGIFGLGLAGLGLGLRRRGKKA